jgi:hypothetical protein
VRDGRIDQARFCREGLAAAHPLLAFHLLSNFILCHGSIAAGVGGPNRAFYSRGAGTVTAISEAMWALSEGDCQRALAGGADSALHLATFVELVLDGFVKQGFVPGEGAAVLAMAREAERPLAILEGTFTGSSVEGRTDEIAILVPWGPLARKLLEERTSTCAVRVDLSLSLGDPLAANVALGCAAAIDLIVAGKTRRAVVMCAGVDGSIGAVRLRAGDAS